MDYVKKGFAEQLSDINFKKAYIKQVYHTFMDEKVKVILIFFIASIIIGVVSDLLLAFAFSRFFGGNPGSQTASIAAPFMASGIASGALTILLLLYPVVKKADRSHNWEDFR